MTVVEKVARVLAQDQYPDQSAVWHDAVWREYIPSANSVLTALHDSFADPVVRDAIQAALDEKEA